MAGLFRKHSQTEPISTVYWAWNSEKLVKQTVLFNFEKTAIRRGLEDPRGSLDLHATGGFGVVAPRTGGNAPIGGGARVSIRGVKSVLGGDQRLDPKLISL